MKKYCLFISALWLLHLAAMAQPGGTEGPQAIGHCSVEGLLTDAITNTPVPFATVALMTPDNNMAVRTTIVADNGTFYMIAPPQQYYVVVKCVGYKIFLSDTFNLVNGSQAKKMKVKLEPSVSQIEEINVTGERSAVQNNLDRKIFNIDKDIVAAGGTAADALKQIPNVTVDEDNRAGMRGGSGLQILIDGRPSGMVDGDNQQALEQIPAAAIERIEIITNPSSQFDAGGTGGIINIVMKKNKGAGFNLAATLSGATREKYGANINANAMLNKVTLFATVGARHNRNLSTGTLFRNAWFIDTAFALQQRSYNIQDQWNYSARVGADIALYKHTTLTTSFNGAINKGVRNENIFYNNYTLPGQFQQPLFASLLERVNEADESRWSYDFQAGLRQQFPKKNIEWTADAIYSRNARTDEQQSMLTYFDSQGTVIDSLSPNQFFEVGNGLRSISAQTDFIYKITSTWKLDVGAKFAVRNNSNSLIRSQSLMQQIQELYAANNKFGFREQISAVYAMLLYAKKKYSLQAGLRHEYTHNTFSNEKQPSVSREFANLFPSAFLKYALSPTSEFGVSYSKRIQRPNMEQQNPYTDFSDPQNIRQGNPNLVPELIHSIEVSNKKIFDAFTLNTTVYYRYNINHITRFRKVTNDGYSVMMFINSAWRKDYGVELSSTGDVRKWWNLIVSANVYNSEVNGSNIEQNLGRKGISWNTRINNNFKFSRNFGVQLSAGYNGPMRGVQGQMQPMYYVDMAAKKDWQRNKYSLTLGLADIFDTRQFEVENTSPYFQFGFVRKRDTRILTLTFAFRFGKFDDKQKPRERNSGEQRGGDMDF